MAPVAQQCILVKLPGRATSWEGRAVFRAEVRRCCGGDSEWHHLASASMVRASSAEAAMQGGTGWPA